MSVRGEGGGERGGVGSEVVVVRCVVGFEVRVVSEVLVEGRRGVGEGSWSGGGVGFGECGRVEVSVEVWVVGVMKRDVVVGSRSGVEGRCNGRRLKYEKGVVVRGLKVDTEVGAVKLSVIGVWWKSRLGEKLGLVGKVRMGVGIKGWVGWGRDRIIVEWFIWHGPISATSAKTKGIGRLFFEKQEIHSPNGVRIRGSESFSQTENGIRLMLASEIGSCYAFIHLEMHKEDSGNLPGSPSFLAAAVVENIQTLLSRKRLTSGAGLKQTLGSSCLSAIARTISLKFLATSG
ncbi:hypothetical protein Tco_1015405 [Tanacetum coccineum]|uniref:Uncharacterized protein n=1 Tax=Tanacetum coccineum TaxID=301880 RepID=A0ABQ5FKT9_9ASTR